VATLSVRAPRRPEVQHPFERRAFVGREPTNDICLADPRASRHHAVFHRDERGRVRVEDLHSRNGTWVDGQKIGRAELREGQQVLIGSTRLFFSSGEVRPTPVAEGEQPDPGTLTIDAGARLPLFADPPSDEGSRQLRRAYRGLVTLYELGNILHAGRDERAIFESIVELVSRTIGADVVSIAELDGESEALVVRHARPVEGLAGSGFSISRSVVEQVLREGRAVLVEDVATDVALDQAQSLHLAGVRCILCAPIRSLREVRGMISAASTTSMGAFGAQELQLLTAIGLQAGVALENRALYRQLEAAFLGTVETLVQALEAKDEYTAGHSRRVSELSVLIGRQLGMTPEQRRELRLEALLHDVGKIGVSEAILNAARRLTDEEFAHIKRHAEFGDTILSPLQGLEKVRSVVRSHHERWDGGGYPDGLAGEQIPSNGRIVAVADTIDAITSRRSYREAGALRIALRELRRCSGTQFDPGVVQALLEVAEAGVGLEDILAERG
jgi:HD-GYP domain-containing protein (c-di-GMP phosphodiesterase class II)